MPRYDYQCRMCRRISEQTHSMLAEPRFYCRCGSRLPMRRIIPDTINLRREIIGEYVNPHLPGKPRFSTWGKYRRYMKRNQLTDDLSGDEILKIAKVNRQRRTDTLKKKARKAAEHRLREARTVEVSA